MASSPTMIEDDIFEICSISDLSFVAGSMDDVFDHDEADPLQSPDPLSTEPIQEFATFMTGTQPPRMISVASMSQASVQSQNLCALKQTPLSSLKELVSKKQQFNTNKRSFTSSLAMSGGTRIASVFNKPSEVLCQAVQKSNIATPASPVHKKQKTWLSALHEACRRGPDLTVAEVEALLHQDPKAASRPVLMTKVKKVYNPASGKVESKVVPETYQFPLNLAISYKASSTVLERLGAAAPDVPSLTDGKSCSLHILLRHKPTDGASADMILLKKPEMVSWTDAKKNSALHVAVSCGASAQIIHHMVILYPEELLQRNFHGQTPFDLARRNSVVCSDEVAAYLLKQVQTSFKAPEEERGFAHTNTQLYRREENDPQETDRDNLYWRGVY
jgi:hypothetical protein